MNLYFIRHADALPLDENSYPDDADRPLSELGKKQCGDLAETLKSMGVVFDLMLVSPLVRAQQTAELLRASLGQTTLVHETIEGLCPGTKSKPFIKELRKLEAQNVILIGHNPDLRNHIAYLTNGDGECFSLAKAGLALVECPASPRKETGRLAWLVTPHWKYKA